ncbi:MAG TPA: alpha/beta hydrolase [Dehalococcoidia bacterium]|nr:alpha/beta hydrolase [Dehalococcoidia bacterium]
MSTLVQPVSRFLDVNSLRLHHLDWGNPDGPPLVCVHGLLSTAHNFDGLARHLQDRFHIIATDVRGRGDSAWSPDGCYSYDDYLADLEGIVDALGLDRFTLVGTSMGGIIAMHYAATHPDRLERLVINDIGPDPEPGSDRITGSTAVFLESFPDFDAALARLREVFPPRATLSETEQRALALAQLRPEPDGRWVSKMDPAIVHQRLAGGSPPRPPLWPALARLSCPTLVVWGTVSDVLSEAQARRMVEVLPAGRLAPVPGVGHAPTLTEPAALAALDAFLKG